MTFFCHIMPKLEAYWQKNKAYTNENHKGKTTILTQTLVIT